MWLLNCVIANDHEQPLFSAQAVQLCSLWSPDLSESAFKRALKTHLFATARRH